MSKQPAHVVPRDANDNPIPSVYSPNQSDGAGQVALQGGPISVDSSGTPSAPVVAQIVGADGVHLLAVDASGRLTISNPGSGGGGGTASAVQILDAGGSNELAVDAAGRIGINNFPSFPSSQAVTAASLPLPTGAAQEGGNLATIATQTAGLAKESGGHLAAIDTASSATSTAAGTTTDAAYVSGSGTLVSLLKGLFGIFHRGATTTANSLSVTLATDEATLPISGTVAVSNLPGTQPVSGTVAVNNFPVTQPVSAATLPLPTNAAQETGGNLATIASQTSGLAKESGGHIATIDTSTSAVSAATGTQADAAWSGSGTGSLAAILKAIYAKVAGTLSVSGTITANAGSGTYTNQQSNVQSDLDTSAGTQNVTLYGVALPASGGAVAGGTASNPLRTDPTGTTTQPISGSVGATQSGTWTVQPGNTANTTPWKVDGSSVTQPVSAASLPLPTGAATSSKQPALGTAGTPASDVLSVQGASGMTALKVDGSAATQPVSATSLPLPLGAATAAKQPTPGTAGAPSADVLTVQGTATMTALKVDGSGVTQPVSAATLPLPTGAASAAKQPALGTAGTPSGDVLTVQGAPSMTALKVDGSGVTQPVSGAVTANAGTNLNTSALALETGGNLATAATNTGALSTVSGTTSDVAVISDASGTLSAKLRGLVKMWADVWDSVNHRLKVDGSAVTQPISAASLPLPAGAATAAKQPAIGTAGAAATDVLSVQGVASMTALKVDGSGVTQPVSGTVTANAGSGSFTVAQATGSNLHAVIDAGSAVIGHVIADSGSTTAVTQPTAANLNAQVVGSVASGASNAGNPVKAGGVFNTTQPTVTNGQVVDLQATAHGAQIVATGTDTLNVTVSAALPGGSNSIGAVTANAGTNLNTSALALDASVSGLLVGQASTTSGEKGPLVQGAVTTGFPAYTTAQTDPLSLNTSGQLRVDPSSAQATYAASITGLVPASSATDIFTLTGSASKTVRITRVSVSATSTAATGAAMDCVLLKRSTADSSGTSTSPTAVPYDSQNAAASATVKAYTANPTLGTIVGNLHVQKLPLPLATDTATDFPPLQPLIWEFGTRLNQPIVLRGTGDVFAVNLNAATPTATASFDISIEWTEI